VVVGKGNNGGDGFVAARHLLNSGVGVTVLSLASLKDIKGDAGVNAGVWLKMGGEVARLKSAADLKRRATLLRHASVIVDGMLGTGLTSPPRGLYAGVIDFINALGKRVVAIDVPSGIDATTGMVPGVAVKADVTATMAVMKTGFFIYPARALAGRIEVVDIGLPRALVTDESIRWNVITGARLTRVLTGRAPDAHKGSSGHLLLLAGSPGRTGAGYMAAMGAMRAGAGLVTIGLPASLEPIMERKTTEAMTAALPETEERTLGTASFKAIAALLKGKSALVVGPGLGCNEEVSSLMERLLGGAGRGKVPMVIDADGLNALVGRLKSLKAATGTGRLVVLTPHPGEAARLLNIKSPEVQRDRVGAAEALVKRTGCVVVLKGPCTIVAAPGPGADSPDIYFNTTGNAGLATAGTGDVLSGMIGGLLAGGYTPLESALVAVYTHGLGADRLAAKDGGPGLVATDLLPVIPALLNSLRCAEGAS
jgi:NAD(P)H-hydrate epimerase